VDTGIGGMIMLKRLVKHGNSRAIVVDKAILEAAGIEEDALFQISVSPSGGLVIQSVLDTKLDGFREKFKELNKQHKKLMQNLADL
jgi:antitoxin component of MazEF toxin-antitoxin module